MKQFVKLRKFCKKNYEINKICDCPLYDMCNKLCGQDTYLFDAIDTWKKVAEELEFCETHMNTWVDAQRGQLPEWEA